MMHCRFYDFEDREASLERPFILSNALVQSFGFPSTWKELRHFEDHPQARREALSQTYGGYV